MEKKFEQHALLLKKLHEVYKEKNKRYGDSFGKTFKEIGQISALTRMYDKFNRIKNLMLNPDISASEDESLMDSLEDLANYCLMTIMELAEAEEDAKNG